MRWHTAPKGLLRRRTEIELSRGLRVDGKRMQVHRTKHLRDGGTKVFEFRDEAGDEHILILHRKLGQEHYESYDGERLEQI